jgi:cytoskeletal protein CcmA (bactofilin family)
MLGKGKQDDVVTLISRGSEVVGNLRFTNQLYLNGRVDGDIGAADHEDATIVVSETGNVLGDIHVPNVVISGQVEGNVYAAGRVELTATARVRGNVHYRLMEMQLGALVEGQLLHHEGQRPTGPMTEDQPELPAS